MLGLVLGLGLRLISGQQVYVMGDGLMLCHWILSPTRIGQRSSAPKMVVYYREPGLLYHLRDGLLYWKNFMRHTLVALK